MAPKKSGKYFLVFVCALAFLCGIGYASIFKAPVTTDARQFDAIGWNLASGKGFVGEDMQPTMFREPGYPFFLSLIYRIFGHSHGAVFVIQAFLFAGIAAMSFFLARYIFDDKTARAASVIVALFPTLGNYTIYLLSEIFFTFLLMALVTALTAWFDKASYIWVFAAGLILGALTLTKAVMLFFAPFMVVGFFIYYFGKKGFLKKFFIGSMIFMLTFTAVVLPWMIHNKKIFGTYSIALRGGKALYNRAIKLDYGPDKWGKIAVYSVSEFLGNKIYPQSGGKTSEFLLLEDHMAEAKTGELMAKGMSPTQADKVLTKEALAKIRPRFMLYIGQSFIEGIKLLGFTHMPSLNENDAVILFASCGGQKTLSLVRGIFRLGAYPIFIMFIGGILVSMREWRRYFAVFAVTFYIMAIYSLTFSWARYTVPLIPFYVIFMAAFLFKCSQNKKVRA